MKISLWCIGKTNEAYLKSGLDIYFKRLKHYCDFEYVEWRDVGHFTNSEDLMRKESAMIMGKLKEDDFLVLLDERGQKNDSVAFSAFIERLQIQSVKHVVFLIGGAFGHHQSIRTRAQKMLSLSEMTFSHQMIRLIFAEQLYRAYTILKNEKYHNP
jgi:23S rRNA (pseudouridine1915-N3)-methyltransferase